MKRKFVFMSRSALLLSSPVASHSCTFGKKFINVLLLVFTLNFCFGQNDSTTYIPFKGIIDLPQTNKKRIWFIAGANVAGYGTSLIFFNKAWYKNYPHTS